jgi:hypothetical protein
MRNWQGRPLFGNTFGMRKKEPGIKGLSLE